MAKKQSSGRGLNIRMFSSEPPNSPKLIKGLFCGRQSQLDFVVDTLRDSLDIRGTQSCKFGKLGAWIIHGESRSGK